MIFLNASRMGKPRIRMKEQCVHSQPRIVFPKKGQIKTNKKIVGNELSLGSAARVHRGQNDASSILAEVRMFSGCETDNSLKAGQVTQTCLTALERSELNPRPHSTTIHKINRVSGWIFLPIPACLLGFPRVLCGLRGYSGSPKICHFCSLSGPIVSVVESTQTARSPQEFRFLRIKINGLGADESSS